MHSISGLLNSTLNRHFVSSAPNLKSDSDSDYSASNSEDEEDGDDDDDKEEEGEKSSAAAVQPKTPNKSVTPAAAAALYKTPAKKSKKIEEVTVSNPYPTGIILVVLQSN